MSGEKDAQRLHVLSTWVATNLQPGAQPFLRSGLRLLWNLTAPRQFNVTLNWDRARTENNGKWAPVVEAVECSAYVFLLHVVETSLASGPDEDLELVGGESAAET